MNYLLDRTCKTFMTMKTYKTNITSMEIYNSCISFIERNKDKKDIFVLYTAVIEFIPRSVDVLKFLDEVGYTKIYKSIIAYYDNVCNLN